MEYFLEVDDFANSFWFFRGVWCNSGPKMFGK